VNEDIQAFNECQPEEYRQICDILAGAIVRALPEAESRIWHAHPVWFLDGNPTVGYSHLKGCIRLFFWSGADFGEEQLKPSTGRFKDASIRYTSPDQVDLRDVERWLGMARDIQWDYRNLIRRKGRLERLK